MTKEQNEILDEITPVDFSKALLRTRILAFIFLCFGAVVAFQAAVTIIDLLNHFTMSHLPKTAVIVLTVIIFMTVFNTKKNYVYFYELNDNSLTLYLLNPFWGKSEETIRLSVIRKITLRRFFFTKFYSVTVLISAKAEKFILVGEIPLQELVPWLKVWKSKFN